MSVCVSVCAWVSRVGDLWSELASSCLCMSVCGVGGGGVESLHEYNLRFGEVTMHS